MTEIQSIYLVFAVTINTVLSHACLKQAMLTIKFPKHFAEFGTFASSAIASPWVWSSLTLQVLGYIAWMAVISRERLAVAVALSGATFYLISGAVGWLVFSERLTPIQMLGLILISIGVWMVAR
jgi:drug/metabolite transporter (DMT)-like permease